MPDLQDASRKDIILDAAEKAFADLGFDGASLRHIVTGTGINLATVYYYFGSKEGLLEAVFNRRFGSLKQKQLDQLHLLQQSQQPLQIETILQAMLSCPLAMTASSSEENQLAKRLLGRMIVDPNPETHKRLRDRHTQVRQAFFDAFHRALPDLPESDLYWRLEFIWGALAFILCNPNWKEQQPFANIQNINTEKILSQMIPFFAAGLRAPSALNTQIS